MLWAILLVLLGVGLFVACLLRKCNTEHMTLSPHVPDIRMWPFYYYTLPYRYQQGGAWPPGMYTRMTHWQPGYDVHGRSFDMRPGMAYDRWPRDRWLKQNGSHYFIDNGTQEDRIYDYWGVR